MTSRVDPRTPLNVEASDLHLGDDLFGAGLIKAILSDAREVVVTTLDDRIISLDPREEVTISRG